MRPDAIDPVCCTEIKRLAIRREDGIVLQMVVGGYDAVELYLLRRYIIYNNVRPVVIDLDLSVAKLVKILMCLVG